MVTSRILFTAKQKDELWERCLVSVADGADLSSECYGYSGHMPGHLSGRCSSPGCPICAPA